MIFITNHRMLTLTVGNNNTQLHSKLLKENTFDGIHTFLSTILVLKQLSKVSKSSVSMYITNPSFNANMK